MHLMRLKTNIWFDDAGIKPFLAAWKASEMTIVSLPLGHFQPHDISFLNNSEIASQAGI